MNRLMRRAVGLVALLSFGAAGCSGGSGGNFSPPPPPPPPPGTAVELNQVYAGVNLVSPVGLMQAPGDSARWFAVQQDGRIWVFDNDPAVAMQSTFLDITGRVSSGGEAGLLGVAFHPGFGTANFDVYVSYTRQMGGLESVVSRFTSNDSGQTLDDTTEVIIMTIAQDQSNHNGGQIAFGPDGYLYGGWGDGGGAGDPLERAQRTNNLLGTITRIDVDGVAPLEIPATNPNFGNALCAGGFGIQACPELYAYGFRNPWRWSFDRQTGDLWVGDVGQDAWEEIDRVMIGMNYGWDDREGAHCFEPMAGCIDSHEDPITEYSHGLGFSVTGGYVYRGSAIPGLVGQYIFGDFGSGRIWRVPASSGMGTAPIQIEDTTLSISSFAEDNDGELYVIDYGVGDIYRLDSQ